MPRFALALLGAALMLVAPVLPVDHASAATPAAGLRVMISGDSITQGFSGSATWRYYLYKEFQRQDVPVDFVGYHHDIGDYGYYLHPDFDEDHSALIGTRLSTQVQRIGQYVADYRPDVVVVMLGRNDLDHGATNEDVDASMRQYVANVRAAKPDTTIVIGQVLDAITYPTTTPLPGASTYNTVYLPGIQADLSTPQSPIEIADTNNGWVPRTMAFDGLHPGSAGETFVADKMAEALVRLGVLHGPVAIYRYTPWEPKPTVTLTALGRGDLKVSWGSVQPQKLRMWQVRIAWARVGRPWTHRTGKIDSRHATYSVLHHLAPGAYAVRIQPIRKWMEGRYGPTVWARVS